MLDRPYKNIRRGSELYYGKHTLMTAVGCSDELLDEAFVGGMLADLADEIGMVRYGDPIVARFSSGVERGISGIQLIETSAIMVHTNDEFRDMYLDVFSCKDYHAKAVVDFVTRNLNPDRLEYRVIMRR